MANVEMVNVLRRCRAAGLALVLTFAAAGTAFAQAGDLYGSWFNINHKDGLERGTGPYAVDSTGLPLNDEAISRTLAYTAAQQWMPDRQCRMWPPIFLVSGPFNLKIFNDVDPSSSKTTSWEIETVRDAVRMKVWMDGRPHPSKNTPHTGFGFATGRWEATTLVVDVTHILASETRRNGVPSSDQATMNLRFLQHGDLMTLVGIQDDPAFFTESLIQSVTFRRAPASAADITHATCVPAYEGSRSASRVPHYLPGQNPSVNELTEYYGIPREAILGGAETMYPEFRKKIKDKFVRPEWCTHYCSPRSNTGDGGGSGPAVVKRPTPTKSTN